MNLRLKPEFVKPFEEGYPLIAKESVESWESVKEEGAVINLLDAKGKFVAKGYFGRQNKGYGWVLSSRKDEKIDVAFFTQKIKAALAYREKLFRDESTTAFRVFNGEGDGIGGLTIDYFDGFYMLTWYSLGIYEFKAAILEALQNATDCRGVYEKRRFDSKGKYLVSDSDFITGEEAPAPLIVKENETKFAIYLDDGAMVGLFLDQREVRKRIKEKYAKGKTVFNAFSYTGAFSVAAALGGATQTTSVDLAKRSLSKTSEQFSINGIDPKTQEIIVEDVFNYFKYALKKKFVYDLVVLDPPSFARSKKRTFSAAKDYVTLLKEAIQITKKGGVIVASTNAASFSMMTFSDFITKAFRELKGRYEILERYSLPQDFRVAKSFKEGDYLKVVFIKKIK